MVRSVSELFDLKDRVALVTGGAGSGYGAQIVEALLEAGCTVVLTSRQAERAQRRVAELRRRFDRVYGETLCLQEEEGIRAGVDSILDRHGRLDILFNNAVLNDMTPLVSLVPEDWERVLAINITAAMLLSRAVSIPMRRQGKGVIVNVSSQYGLVAPDPKLYAGRASGSSLVYGTSKAALLQMTRHLAVEWAPIIRVNSLTAGGLYAGQDAGFVARYSERTPLCRMAGPEDMKGAAVFLASDASSWMTGQNLIIDGGWTVW